MVEYKECYVAFLDILGFKNLINKSGCEKIYQIFTTVLEFEPRPLVKNVDVYANIQHTIMSDSIVVYIDASVTDGFIALTDVCAQIQMRLLHNNPPILVRGGIAKGTLYHKDNMLFGTGLTRAYILENSAAIYPRIVFTEELRKNALENTGKLFIFDFNSMYYSKDSDEMYYVDFLRTFNYVKTIEPKTMDEAIQADNLYFHTLFEYVTEVLDKEIDTSIRNKYLWLKRKIENRIECMPQVKKYFEDLRTKEKEAAEERFGKAVVGNSENP
ncbi:MAG: hypothetical protein IKL78_04605 [Lachnospiraceae bacterium]|nr:hypothetical protein [Lachnospiraceae bacterium]